MYGVHQPIRQRYGAWTRNALSLPIPPLSHMHCDISRRSTEYGVCHCTPVRRQVAASCNYVIGRQVFCQLRVAPACSMLLAAVVGCNFTTYGRAALKGTKSRQEHKTWPGEASATENASKKKGRYARSIVPAGLARAFGDESKCLLQSHRGLSFKSKHILCGHFVRFTGAIL